jgi:hypothetical protein
MTKTTAGALCALLGLAACAPTQWQPLTSEAATELPQRQAACDEQALGASESSGNVTAFGSNAFVMGAALGSALHKAAVEHRIFADCMIQAGYQPVQQ